MCAFIRVSVQILLCVFIKASQLAPTLLYKLPAQCLLALLRLRFLLLAAQLQKLPPVTQQAVPRLKFHLSRLVMAQLFKRLLLHQQPGLYRPLVKQPRHPRYCYDCGAL